MNLYNDIKIFLKENTENCQGIILKKIMPKQSLLDFINNFITKYQDFLKVNTLTEEMINDLNYLNQILPGNKSVKFNPINQVRIFEKEYIPPELPPLPESSGIMLEDYDEERALLPLSKYIKNQGENYNFKFNPAAPTVTETIRAWRAIMIENRIPMPMHHSAILNQLLLAASKDNIETIKYILAQYSVGINDQDPEGDSALFWAIYRNQKDTAKFLMEHGADAEIKDNLGQTPLGLAKELGCTEIVSIIRHVNNQYSDLLDFLHFKDKLYQETKNKKEKFLPNFKESDPKAENRIKDLIEQVLNYKKSFEPDKKDDYINFILQILLEIQEEHRVNLLSPWGSFNFEFVKILPDDMQKVLLEKLQLEPRDLNKHTLKAALNEFHHTALPTQKTKKDNLYP